MAAAKTITTPDALDQAKVREIAANLATAASIYQNANAKGVIGDAREVALLQKLARQVGEVALHDAEALLGETVNYE